MYQICNTGLLLPIRSKPLNIQKGNLLSVASGHGKCITLFSLARPLTVRPWLQDVMAGL